MPSFLRLIERNERGDLVVKLPILIALAVMLDVIGILILKSWGAAPDFGPGATIALMVSALCAALAAFVLVDWLLQITTDRNVIIPPLFDDRQQSTEPLATLLPGLPPYFLGIGILIGYTVFT